MGMELYLFGKFLLYQGFSFFVFQILIISSTAQGETVQLVGNNINNVLCKYTPKDCPICTSQSFKSMGELNTIRSACTLYRHLG